jgi:flagellin-like protein
MKANKAFRTADEAVSPVIGVILMVAITVVLAAVVFVLVTRLAGNQQQQAPSITFDTQSTSTGFGGRLTVVAAQGGSINWSDICIKDSSGNTASVWTANGAASGCATPPASNVYCTLPDGNTRVQAGDVVDCRNSAQGGPASNTATAGTRYDGPFTAFHISANSAFKTFQFHT